MGLIKSFWALKGVRRGRRPREFMLFTNDLDRKRDQDFKNVQRELYELILGKWFQMV